MLSGFGFLLGAGDLPREVGLPGTIDCARRLGFLCVCSDLSTFRRPAVTAEPWLSWSKTADMSLLGAAALITGGGPGGGGGGGGGGAPPASFAAAAGGAATEEDPDDTCFSASITSMPSLSFHVTPRG